MDQLQIATFRFDVTPPIGHSLCGGWIKSVAGIDDPLEAIGFVLLGAGDPIVVCAVDWTIIANGSHIAWRAALAEAAKTTPDRVAVQCVHQHSAPMSCLGAQEIVGAHADLPHIVDPVFQQDCLKRGKFAVAGALREARAVTHIAHGEAKLEQIASNRRVHRDAGGRVIANRDSNGPTAELRALPEGLIDPWLKTIALFHGSRKLVACHYYATHPMSYYGDGRVSSDFAGLARRQRQLDEPDCLHLYFTGCAGNVAAGKYNDGSLPMRPILTQRLYNGIIRSEQGLQPQPIEQVSWRSVELLPPVRDTISASALQSQIRDPRNSLIDRCRPAFMLSWLRRVQANIPLSLSALHINNATLLHLPGECFVEYQLRAQELDPKQFVAVAGYGDGGPWYIPTKDEYSLGGYETTVAFADPAIDDLLTEAMRTLVG